MSAGRVRVVGLGPGPADWRTPEADAALARASDVLGYAPYLDRLSLAPSQRRHASDNREEIAARPRRARPRRRGRRRGVGLGRRSRDFRDGGGLDRGGRGRASRRGARSTSRFCRASARCRRRRRGSARRSGHDFCAISLSDNLKPWDVVARRLSCAAEGDFVIALYNPASKARPRRIHDAFALLRSLKAGATPVAFARAVGRADEKLTLTNLHDADPGLADMATLVMIGSSETRWVARDGARPWMLTPRSYGAGR